MRLTTSPEALPGSCIFCGSGSRGLYLDTGLSVEFHGALYICVEECLAGMANLAQFLNPQLRGRYEEALVKLYNENLRLQEINAQQKEALDGLRNLDRTDPAGSLAHNVSSVGNQKDLKRALAEGKRLENGEGITPEQSDEHELVGVRATKRVDDDEPYGQFTGLGI